MGSYLVIGMGRFGASIAQELFQMKHDVLVVEKDEDIASGMVNLVTEVVIGDAKDEAVLQSLDISSYDCVIVTMADAIEDSVLATISLKELGAKRIVCKAQNERHAKILSLLGADRVVLPEADMGRRIAHSLVQTNVIDSLELSPDYGILEIQTPVQWVGKSIAENNLLEKYGIAIISLRTAGTGTIRFSLDVNEALHQSDVLTVIGSKKELEAISALK